MGEVNATEGITDALAGQNKRGKGGRFFFLQIDSCASVHVVGGKLASRSPTGDLEEATWSS